MHLTVAEARALCEGVLGRNGFAGDDARLITDVLVEAHLWGRPDSGLCHLSHAVSGGARGEIRVVREDERSALIDGGNNPGFLVASRAMLMAIGKAKAAGIALVGANNSYMGGINGYYVSLAAREGLVAFMCQSSAPRVAPAGAADPVFGTNPLAIAIPCDGDPVIFDIATSTTNNGSIHRAARLGEQLPEGVAIDAEGRPTTDPARALEGAVLAFGGHKGAGLAMIVQCLGILAGGAVAPGGMRNFGYFFLVIDPAIFMPAEDYRARIGELVGRVRTARPLPGGEPVRVPGERSMAHRARALVEGIEIDDPLYEELRSL